MDIVPEGREESDLKTPQREYSNSDGVYLFMGRVRKVNEFEALRDRRNEKLAEPQPHEKTKHQNFYQELPEGSEG